jgi:hypothetical protein
MTKPQHWVRAGALAAALASTAASALAATFDFESVAPPAFTGTAVPDGYAGATWTGLVLRRTTDPGLAGAGFILNGTTMALGTDTAPSITFAVPTVYGGALVGNSAVGGSTVSYDLYLGATLAASSGAIAFNAVFLPSIYSGAIDKIVFHVAGSNRFSFDDLQATAAVPEAQSAWMLLAGLAGVGGLLRRRLSTQHR